MYLHIHGFYTGSLKVRLLVSDFGGPMRCVQARECAIPVCPAANKSWARASENQRNFHGAMARGAEKPFVGILQQIIYLLHSDEVPYDSSYRLVQY